MGRFKLGLLMGAGVGYVLGSKAGRETYEKIEQMWNDFTGRPEVQRVTSTIEQRTEQLKGKAKEGAGDLAFAAEEKINDAADKAEKTIDVAKDKAEQKVRSSSGR